MKNIFDHFLMGEYVYTHSMLPVCKKHHINFTELTIIMFLFNNPSLDTASDIVKCRNIAKSHVSVSVRSLEQRGLITKMYQNGNRKSVHLKLTKLASQIVNDGRSAQNHFMELIFDGVTENEKSTISKIFQKIDHNLRIYTKGGNKINEK
ncbi:MAG: MarR family transcriptional regulator [Clostridia bacterium]|nr:MarR family transcriptional regulator [Clostridia bacterium]